MRPENLAVVDLGKDKMPRRVWPQQDEAIDRGTLIKFRYNRKQYNAYPGDTVAAALIAAGVDRLGWSITKRPRGVFCAAGHCGRCLVEIEGKARLACRTSITADMVVRTLSQRRMNNEQKMAGEVDYTFVNLSTDLVVVGGGPAGLGAALFAAEAGIRVILVDENYALGGHLRYTPVRGGVMASSLNDLLQAVEKEKKITVLTGAKIGAIEAGWKIRVLGAEVGWDITAGGVVMATGAYDRPLIFPGNDKPGVYSATGVLRLMMEYGVVPGKRVVVVTTDEMGITAALALHTAGVEVAAVLVENSGENLTNTRSLKDRDIAVLYWHTLLAVNGTRVKSASLACMDNQGYAVPETAHKINCDAIVVSTGQIPALELVQLCGGHIEFDATAGNFRVLDTPPGIWLAGRVAGVLNDALVLADGQRIGQVAASYLGKTKKRQAAIKVEYLDDGVEARINRGSKRIWCIKDNKALICACQDLQAGDIATALAIGCRDMAMVCQQTEIMRGYCQGKMCAPYLAQLMHAKTGAVEENWQDVFIAKSLGEMEDLEEEHSAKGKSPTYLWHREQQVDLAASDGWWWPQTYSDVATEVQAVRQAVGLADLSCQTKICCNGPLVNEALAGLGGTDWATIAPGTSQHMVLKDDDNRVLVEVVVGRISDKEWYLTCPPQQSRMLIDLLENANVLAEDVTQAYAMFMLVGSGVNNVLDILTEGSIASTAAPFMVGEQIAVAGIMCRTGYWNDRGILKCELHCAWTTGAELWERLIGYPEIQPIGQQALDIVRLEEGHFSLVADAWTQTYPLLDDIVQMDPSGLMRVDPSGRYLYLRPFKILSSHLVPEPGHQIVQSIEKNKKELIGWVSSCAYSPYLGAAIGLAWLPMEQAKPGMIFMVDMGETSASGCVHEGSFYEETRSAIQA